MSDVTTIEFKRWVLLVDAQRTSAGYAKLKHGYPEKCGCLPCRNFAAAREVGYPAEVRTLFDKLGVYPIREAEVYHNCEIRDGIHSYGGFLHAVGRIISGTDCRVKVTETTGRFDLEPIANGFQIGFTADTALVPECFAKEEVFQIEFLAEVPWVLHERYTT